MGVFLVWRAARDKAASHPHCSAQVPSHLLPKNSHSGCFLNGKSPLGFRVPADYRSITKRSTFRYSFLFGALQGTRTPDLLVRSQTLYPAELAAHDFRQLLYISTKGRVCQELFAKNSAKNPVLNCAVLVQINRKCAYSSFRSRLQGFLPYSKNRNRWDDNRPLCHCLLPRP